MYLKRFAAIWHVLPGMQAASTQEECRIHVLPCLGRPLAGSMHA